MAISTIQNLRGFVRRLDYHVQREENFQIESGKLKNRTAAILDLLNVHFSTLFREFRIMDQCVVRLDASYDSLKAIWSAFVNSVIQQNDQICVNYTQFQAVFPKIAELFEFQDTDLILFEDHYPQPLPLYGIRKSDLPNLLKEYNDFVQRLRITNFPGFKERILRDIRMLMSRPLGRELIRRLLLNSRWIGLDIIKSNQYCYPCPNIGLFSGWFRIEITNKIGMSFCEINEEGLDSFETPNYIEIAHELLHLLHDLEGVVISHDYTSSPPADFTLWEEHATIVGFCPCHGNLLISERSLREQFNLPIRKYYIDPSGNDGRQVPPVMQFISALHFGARAQLVRTAPYVTDVMLDYGVQFLLSKGDLLSYASLYASAMINPQLRRGPFANLAFPALV